MFLFFSEDIFSSALSPAETHVLLISSAIVPDMLNLYLSPDTVMSVLYDRMKNCLLWYCLDVAGPETKITIVPDMLNLYLSTGMDCFPPAQHLSL